MTPTEKWIDKRKQDESPTTRLLAHGGARIESLSDWLKLRERMGEPVSMRQKARPTAVELSRASQRAELRRMGYSPEAIDKIAPEIPPLCPEERESYLARGLTPEKIEVLKSVNSVKDYQRLIRGGAA